MRHIARFAFPSRDCAELHRLTWNFGISRLALYPCCLYFFAAHAQSAMPPRRTPCLIAVLPCSLETRGGFRSCARVILTAGGILSPSGAKGFGNRLGPVQIFDLTCPVDQLADLHPLALLMTHTRLRLGRLEGEPQALFRHRRRRSLPLLVPPPFHPRLCDSPAVHTPYFALCLACTHPERRSRSRGAAVLAVCSRGQAGAQGPELGWWQNSPKKSFS